MSIRGSAIGVHRSHKLIGKDGVLLGAFLSNDRFRGRTYSATITGRPGLDERYQKIAPRHELLLLRGLLKRRIRNAKHLKSDFFG
jgi:hypothetical protein